MGLIFRYGHEPREGSVCGCPLLSAPFLPVALGLRVTGLAEVPVSVRVFAVAVELAPRLRQTTAATPLLAFGYISDHYSRFVHYQGDIIDYQRRRREFGQLHKLWSDVHGLFGFLQEAAEVHRTPVFTCGRRWVRLWIDEIHRVIIDCRRLCEQWRKRLGVFLGRVQHFVNQGTVATPFGGLPQIPFKLRTILGSCRHGFISSYDHTCIYAACSLPRAEAAEQTAHGDDTTVVRLEGFEPPTSRFVIWRSIR